MVAGFDGEPLDLQITDEMMISEYAIASYIARSLGLDIHGKSFSFLLAWIRDTSPAVHDTLIALVLELRAWMRSKSRDELISRKVEDHAHRVAVLLRCLGAK